MELKDYLDGLVLTQTARDTEIPLRTLENWKRGVKPTFNELKFVHYLSGGDAEKMKKIIEEIIKKD